MWFCLSCEPLDSRIICGIIFKRCKHILVQVKNIIFVASSAILCISPKWEHKANLFFIQIMQFVFRLKVDPYPLYDMLCMRFSSLHSFYLGQRKCIKSDINLWSQIFVEYCHLYKFTSQFWWYYFKLFDKKSFLIASKNWDREIVF